MTYGRDYGEEAAKAIDEEVDIILDTAYDRAREIISDNKDRLVDLANTLIKVETLDRDEFEAVMNRELSEEESVIEPIEE